MLLALQISHYRYASWFDGACNNVDDQEAKGEGSRNNLVMYLNLLFAIIVDNIFTQIDRALIGLERITFV